MTVLPGSLITSGGSIVSGGSILSGGSVLSGGSILPGGSILSSGSILSGGAIISQTSIMASAMQGRSFFEWVALITERYGVWLLRGAGVTLLIALSGTIIGFVIGLLIGVIRTIPLSKGEKRTSLRTAALKCVNFILTCYIEVFRGTPMIVQAVVIYYGLMEMYGIDLSPFSAGLLVVSINTGAYMAEIVRGGIESIDKGQTEAAHAIGMTHSQTMKNVILPQAIRNILPATSNEFVINIKDTSVLNVISVSELFFTARSIKGIVFRSYEPYLVVCAIYFILTFSVTRALRFIEKKMDGPESYTIHGSSTMPGSAFVVREE